MRLLDLKEPLISKIVDLTVSELLFHRFYEAKIYEYEVEGCKNRENDFEPEYCRVSFDSHEVAMPKYVAEDEDLQEDCTAEAA